MRYLPLFVLLALTGLHESQTLAANAAAAPLAAGSTFKDCAECPDMVVVPAGRNKIGSSPEERARVGVPAMFGDREGPQHRVRIARPYALATTEVTRGKYAVFVTATSRPDPTECAIADTTTFAWGQKPGYSWREPGYPQTDAHPAVCISYNDATDYAAWLAQKSGKPYRLPTEAEWELAARAGSSTAWYWGDAPEAGCDQANLITSGMISAMGSPPYWQNKLACQNARSYSLPAGSYPANAYGLHDMIGNAFEWVVDCASTSHKGEPSDGSARQTPNCDTRFLKGGAFHTPIWLTRAAVRGNPLKQNLHMNTIGFRVARSLE
jgi:formylglycine-generating enzyme required for sulfatase activity